MTPDDFKAYSNNKVFIVEDVIPDSPVDVILVLESPGNEEMKNSCPLAGRSGVSICKCLGCCDDGNAFGPYVKEKYNNIALINVSRVPLQKTKYKGESYPDSISFEALNRIRSRKQLYNNEQHNIIMDCLEQDFDSRLEKIKRSGNCKIIACGNFAQL